MNKTKKFITAATAGMFALTLTQGVASAATPAENIVQAIDNVHTIKNNIHTLNHNIDSVTGGKVALSSNNFNDHSNNEELSSSEIRQAEHTVMDLINNQRQTQGLPNLSWNSSLYSSAKSNSENMAWRNSIDHGDFAGRTEASAYTEKSTPLELSDDVVTQWTNSRGHWDIITSKESHSGAVGITPTTWRNGEHVYVVVFQGD